MNLIADGFWGKNTLNSINSVDSKDLYIIYRDCRIEYYKNIANSRSKNKKYLKGWINRANTFNAY